MLIQHVLRPGVSMPKIILNRKLSLKVLGIWQTSFPCLARVDDISQLRSPEKFP